MVWENTEGWELSIKDEIKELIDRRGREAYLRKKTDQKCNCLDPTTGEPDIDCPTCSSSGYVYLDHKIRIYRQVVTRPMSGAYRKDISDVGFMSVDESTIYVQMVDLFPSIHDWVVEVKTNSKGNIVYPALIERINDIGEIYDLRENYGQVAFYALRTRKVELGK